jgi:hypothetical protein
MIADFPEAKKELKKAVDSLLKQRVKENAPMFALVKKKTLHEGNRTGVLHEDGRHVVRELMHVQSQFTVTKEETTEDPGKFLEKVAKAAEDVAGQMERSFFQIIDESVKESGNIIPGNPSLSPDSILLALETIAVDFEDDDREKPVRPTIVSGPGAAEQLKKIEGEQTEEDREKFRQREKEILDKKYEEHMTNVRSRRIVD